MLQAMLAMEGGHSVASVADVAKVHQPPFAAPTKPASGVLSCPPNWPPAVHVLSRPSNLAACLVCAILSLYRVFRPPFLVVCFPVAGEGVKDVPRADDQQKVSCTASYNHIYIFMSG